MQFSRGGDGSMDTGSDARKRPLVLVVDDERGVRDTLAEALAVYGFEVLTAADGQEAWEIFQEKDPALVISDIYMPRMNGLMLLKQIKEVSPQRAVILATGYHHYKQLIETNSHPPDGFVNKPFRIEALYEAIARVISGAQHTQE